MTLVIINQYLRRTPSTFPNCPIIQLPRMNMARLTAMFAVTKTLGDEPVAFSAPTASITVLPV